MAGFNMHKWFASSAELRNVINCNEGNKIFKNVLGLKWNKDDEIVFDFEGLVAEMVKIPVTNRNILKIGAKFYDPLGLISPVTVISKVFFQKVCLSHKHWDEILSDDIEKGWTLH